MRWPTTSLADEAPTADSGGGDGGRLAAGLNLFINGVRTRFQRELPGRVPAGPDRPTVQAPCGLHS